MNREAAARARITPSEREAAWTQTRTSAGSRDTELKALAVSPATGPPGAASVTTVTPVAKRPSASRKCRRSASALAWAQAPADHSESGTGAPGFGGIGGMHSVCPASAETKGNTPFKVTACRLDRRRRAVAAGAVRLLMQSGGKNQEEKFVKIGDSILFFLRLTPGLSDAAAKQR